MTSKDPHVPFSQRTGLAPVPAQLQLGVVSAELRRLLDYSIELEFQREVGSGSTNAYFRENLERVAQDLHVVFFGRPARSFNDTPYEVRRELESYIQRAKIGDLFDFVEFLARHRGCSEEMKRDLAEAFVTSRSAYRIMDAQIVAIGTEEQGATVEAAIASAEANGDAAARSHLIAAGKQLRDGNWADSVRESIHAVEAMALKLVPGEATLGAALNKLEKDGHLHGSLKKAFSSLYGYTNDERGVRHSLAFGDEAQVDEADALFMFGACASFVSYLIIRSNQK